MIRYTKRRNIDQLDWKDLVFDEIFMLIKSALFCRLILNLIGPGYPYSTPSSCEILSGLSTCFDCIIISHFCLLVELSVNLCIGDNIQEIKRFSETTKGLYFTGFFYVSIWYVAILMPFTILYTYFEGKNLYSSDELYSDFNECKKEWVMVWRYVSNIPLLFGFFYPIVKMCLNKNFNNLKQNWRNGQMAIVRLTNNMDDNQKNNIKYIRLRRIAMKNCLYIVVFYISLVFAIVRGFYNVFGTIYSDDDNAGSITIAIEPPFLIACLSCLFESSYGLLNFIVYCYIVYVIDCKNNHDQADNGSGMTNISEDDALK